MRKLVGVGEDRMVSKEKDCNEEIRKSGVVVVQ